MNDIFSFFFRVSIFPVGLVSRLFVSTPILNYQGQFKGFYEGWGGNRTYILDMAGFATNVKHFVSKAQHFYSKGKYALTCRCYNSYFSPSGKHKSLFIIFLLNVCIFKIVVLQCQSLICLTLKNR